MKIELRPIESVTPYPGNPRINDQAVDAVAASLKEFGFRQPIVVDADGVIIVGHTRYKAAIKLGLVKVPVHVATDLTPAQVRAYRLADNQTATIAEWDMDMLAIELSALKEMDVDLSVLGWSPDELDEIMAPEGTQGLTDPDDIPAPPDAAITRPGDLWVLGNHRLLCGDSARPEHVDRLLEGGTVHLVNTDPPYNVKVEPRSNNAIAAGLSSFEASPAAGRVGAGLPRQGDGSKPHMATTGAATHLKLRAKDRPLANDFMSDADFDVCLNGWFGTIARVLIPGGGFYIWGGYANCGNYPPVLVRHELYFAQAVIWVKEHPVLTRKDFMGNHEWCFYGWRSAAHRFFGPKNIPDVWPVKKLHSSKMVHLTEKPVELARRAIEYSSKPGESVLDLFGGSGSTLIACEQMGRRAFLMELDTLYCDVIVQRWEQFTGKKAERIPAPSSTGVAPARAPAPSAAPVAAVAAATRAPATAVTAPAVTPVATPKKSPRTPRSARRSAASGTAPRTKGRITA